MPHLKYWYGQVFSGCESAELLRASLHQLAIFLSILVALAVVRKNAIHVSICHSCGMTVERGRRRTVFFPASLNTVLEFLTLWHVSIPTTHLQKTPLTRHARWHRKYGVGWVFWVPSCSSVLQERPFPVTSGVLMKQLFQYGNHKPLVA